MTTARALAALLAAGCLPLAPSPVVLAAEAAAETSSAWAAQETDPRALLTKARGALLDSGGFEAKLTLSGDGADLFKSLLPSGSGTLRYARAADGSAALRFVGSTTENPSRPASAVDASLHQNANQNADQDADQDADQPGSTSIVRALTRAPNRVFERPAGGASHQSAAIFWLMRLTDLTDAEPLAPALNAPELSLEEPREIAGELCDVVLAAEPESPRAGTPRPGQGFTHARWFIARSDGLPRRIERVNQTDFGNFALAVELTELTPSQSLAPSDLIVQQPDGFRLDSTLTPAAPAVNDAAQAAPNGRPTPTGNRNPAEPVGPRRALAPVFDITPLSGEPAAISTSSQQDAERPTLLWFFGTWSLASQREMPEIARVLVELGSELDAVALAVPPADDTRVVESTALAGLIPAIATPELLDAFDIVVHPTAVVIDAEGRLVGRSVIEKDADPGDRAAEIADLIREALGEATTAE